jgi:5-methylcytosine-specific restriction endonuclease McrA
MKTCSACKQEKDDGDFAKKRGQCLSCRVAYNKGWRERNRDRDRQHKRSWAEKNIEYVRNHQRESMRARRASNPNYSREQYEKHKDVKLKRKSQYYKENPDKVLVYVQARRARKANAEGSYTAKEWRELCAAHDHRCANCGASGKLTVDHVIPLVKGGSNLISNIQPLCLPCNLSKGTRSVQDWIMARNN